MTSGGARNRAVSMNYDQETKVFWPTREKPDLRVILWNKWEVVSRL
jgi:hypothetical protein